MLQIASGKFFEEPGVIEHRGRAVLYSNYSWVGEIATVAGTLHPVDPYIGSAAAYVLEYTNRMAPGPSGNFTIYRVGDEEIVRQFSHAASFALSAFFDVDRASIEHNCRKQPRSGADRFLPSKFIQGHFDANINGTLEANASFARFVSKLIGLKRPVFNRVSQALANYCGALELLNQNVDLSYSLLVYCLESISEKPDTPPSWDAVETAVTRELDDDLPDSHSEAGIRIRGKLARLLVSRSQRQFVEFCLKRMHLSGFFAQGEGALSLRVSEAPRALANAYQMRSRFVHQLRPISAQLRNPQITSGDVFRMSDVHLTIRGLIRVVRSVLNNYIENAESIERETYAWRGELPGVLTMPAAPKYWLWKTDNLSAAHAPAKWKGFLDSLCDALFSDGVMVDLTALIEQVPILLRTANRKQELQWLSLYFLYSVLVGSRDPESLQEMWERHESLFAECSIEALAVRLFLGWPLEWSATDLADCYRAYDQRRFHASEVVIPQALEVGILISIAAVSLAANDVGTFDTLMSRAIDEASGDRTVQEWISDARSARRALRVG